MFKNTAKKVATKKLTDKPITRTVKSMLKYLPSMSKSANKRRMSRPAQMNLVFVIVFPYLICQPNKLITGIMMTQ